ncbi:hypothetical protein MRX96_041562 [Rhipicephalus microplus]
MPWPVGHNLFHTRQQEQALCAPASRVQLTLKAARADDAVNPKKSHRPPDSSVRPIKSPRGRRERDTANWAPASGGTHGERGEGRFEESDGWLCFPRACIASPRDARKETPIRDVRGRFIFGPCLMASLLLVGCCFVSGCPSLSLSSQLSFLFLLYDESATRHGSLSALTKSLRCLAGRNRSAACHKQAAMHNRRRSGTRRMAGHHGRAHEAPVMTQVVAFAFSEDLTQSAIHYFTPSIW